jgi:hypothetical protein
MSAVLARLREQHEVQWVTAAPLWAGAAGDPTAMQRPSLLGFASDTFMDDLAALLATDPAALTDLQARPESHRARPTGAPPGWTPQASTLKLFQPAHGRFYLVAASLVCRLVGLPDRAVHVPNAESVGFVLRRLDPDGQEMAWVVDRRPGGQTGWAALSPGQAEQVAAAEEVLPMFPQTFQQGDRRRRLWLGFIPTTSRDTYQAAGALAPFAPDLDASGQPVDTRFQEFEARVLQSLAALQQPPQNPPPASDPAATLLDQSQREASRFLVLDLADLLATHLPALATQISQGVRPPAGDSGRALYDLLNGSSVAGAGSPTWREAVRDAAAQWAAITGESGTPPAPTFNLKSSPLTSALLGPPLQAALGAPPATPVAAPAPPVPKLDPSGQALYRLRCVFRRPHCGPLHPDVVSKPTQSFAIAPFFDFDAPTRPIRISLPIDTSLAGLRKFDKNVAFLISNKLREQMASVTDLKKALDGNLASGQSFDLGVICSFSIPIITICALIILLVFVILLNIVFWWLPFFRICLPIGLKAR